MFKRLIRLVCNTLGYDVRRLRVTPGRCASAPVAYGIPDEQYYTPLFSPWLGYGGFAQFYAVAQPYTLVSPDRCHVLWILSRQSALLSGVWMECGVYRGGTAMLLAKTIADRGLPVALHLFDTFAGMPETDPAVDLHRWGDFSDVVFSEVRERIQSVCGGRTDIPVFHPGFIPDTFVECGISTVSFAHVDVDIYRSVMDCCEFIYPRLLAGGFLVFDDYGAPTCPGARRAVDEFFAGRPEIPLVLPTGQAVVMKCATSPGERS